MLRSIATQTLSVLARLIEREAPGSRLHIEGDTERITRIDMRPTMQFSVPFEMDF